jgi:hypothetical protein
VDFQLKEVMTDIRVIEITSITSSILLLMDDY